MEWAEWLQTYALCKGQHRSSSELPSIINMTSGWAKHTNGGILQASALSPYQNPQVSLEDGAEDTEQIREQTRQQIEVSL